MRKYIDILNEFVSSDFNDRGGDQGQTYLVYDILWDVEPEQEAELPKRITVSSEEVDAAQDPYADDPDPDTFSKIGQWLSDTYGSGLSNFNYRAI